MSDSCSPLVVWLSISIIFSIFLFFFFPFMNQTSKHQTPPTLFNSSSPFPRKGVWCNLPVFLFLMIKFYVFFYSSCTFFCTVIKKKPVFIYGGRCCPLIQFFSSNQWMRLYNSKKLKREKNKKIISFFNLICCCVRFFRLPNIFT